MKARLLLDRGWGALCQWKICAPWYEIPRVARYACHIRLRHCILPIWSWQNVFGEQSANHQQLLVTGRKFICSLYGVAVGESMASARYALYTKRTRGKAVCVKTLPPTDANLSYHILRAHYQVILLKAADQQTPPAVDIAAYGWELVSSAGCVPTPRIARVPAAPPALMDYQCKAVGKACSSHAFSCHSAGLSCTPYCQCVGEAMCFNPFTKHDENARYDRHARHDNEDEGDSMEEEGS